MLRNVEKRSWIPSLSLLESRSRKPGKRNILKPHVQSAPMDGLTKIMMWPSSRNISILLEPLVDISKLEIPIVMDCYVASNLKIVITSVGSKDSHQIIDRSYSSHTGDVVSIISITIRKILDRSHQQSHQRFNPMDVSVLARKISSHPRSKWGRGQENWHSAPWGKSRSSNHFLRFKRP